MKKSVCSKCGKIVPQGEGCEKSYCIRGKSGFRNKKKSDPWYNLPVWKGNPNKPLGQRGGAREAQLIKQPFCEECSSEGVMNDVTGKGQGHVDHIIAFRSGRSKEHQWQLFLDPNNHKTLCVNHHMSKTGRG